MLVLSRKRQESIVVGRGPGRIKLTIVDIRGDKVRIGIDAPREMEIDREEVRKQKDERAAAKP